jgi:hypothetical protein
MAPIAPHNLTPFGPAKDGTALAPRDMISVVRGPAGRYATAAAE